MGQLRHFSAQRGKEKLDHDGMKIARYNYDAVCQILGSRGVRIDREPVDIVKELISQAIGKENMGVWEKPAALQGWSYYQWLDRDGNALIAAFCKGVTMDWWVEDKPV
ncbi:MAG: hypothetical protein EPN94_12560 [Nitrospirae bacterium]|nr:MAG: hypothetical protein EPN94_12560 [Nitrospirota bacterium]